MKTKTKNSVKRSKIITQEQKIIENPNIFEIKGCKKNAKITKQPHAYKDYASTYNVENLNYFK